MTGAQPSLDAAQAARWLSTPRYRRYLGVADGDHTLAMETYLWNSRVAAAGIVDVGHLEVALRNAYDRELTRRFPNWAIDPQAPVFHLEQRRPTSPHPAAPPQPDKLGPDHRCQAGAEFGTDACKGRGSVDIRVLVESDRG